MEEFKIMKYLYRNNKSNRVIDIIEIYENNVKVFIESDVDSLEVLETQVKNNKTIESYLKAGYEEKTKDEIGDIYNNIIINKLENRLQQINIERLSVETELEYRRNKIN
jgi:hypothetical protein